jgi:hypothetical protein
VTEENPALTRPKPSAPPRPKELTIERDDLQPGGQLGAGRYRLSRDTAVVA